MRSRWLILGIVALILIIVVIVAATALVTPDDNPAFAAATRFVEAVGRGDNTTAGRLIGADLANWVVENCDGLVGVCIERYVPGEWGDFLSVVFRRAAPFGEAWDVELIATYEQGLGFSGVCIYNRVEKTQAETWIVTAWSGWVSCGDPSAQTLANHPDAPNRAP
jgi:hypothetical protein